MIQYFNQVS